MDYLETLSKDRKLKKLLALEIKHPKKRKNVTMGLVSSIVSQQLSTKVAKVIKDRFLSLFDGKDPTPEMILKVSKVKLRSIGLSEQKANYVHNVAAFMVEHKVTRAKLHKMDDEEVIALLSQIKGVGRWTVEMLLIFVLGREDVFALDDYGIQKAMIELYKLDGLTKKELREAMLKISKKWSPYRSFASLYLWKSLDT